MSEPAPFMPTTPAGTTPPGAYVVPLARARFIMKGQFFHPIKESDQPLPVHQFYLLCLTDKTVKPVLGEPSQLDGVSWINFTDDASEEIAGSKWAIGWRPLVKKPDGTFAPTDDAGKGEGWLDLDKMEWVDFKDIGFVDKRKLLRVPLWASHLKAKQGGFKESPKKTNFGATGILDFDKGELNAFGQPETPWTIQIDQGLFRAHVRFIYYDPKEKKNKPVPPGLVVHAIGARALSGPATGTSSRVAAGTALDDDGTVYLLHERTKANLAQSAFGYFFFTGTAGSTLHGLVDFSQAAARDKVVTLVNDPSAKRVDRYLLPREWHSKGAEAWTKEDGAGVPQRKDFAALRTEATTKSEPLRFHLDDALLANTQTDPVVVKKDTRATLMDHLLHVRDADPKKPHLWKAKMPRNYLRAEEAVFVAGDGPDTMTRIVFSDGIVYELRDKRLQAATGASFGTVNGIGMRAAITNDFDAKHQHISYMSGNPSMPDFLGQTKGRTVQHLIDVSDDVIHTVGGKNVKLLHLLTWVPTFFDNTIGADGEKAMAQLAPAAERINQTHPGHPSQPAANRKPAEFVLAPDGVIADGGKIVRVRHFYAEVPKTFTDAVKIFLTQSADPQARAGASALGKVVTMFKGDIGPSFDPELEPGQDKATSRFTLAHEMGHIVGFPDEYTEDQVTLLDPFAGWDQYMVNSQAARPFEQDTVSLMRSNNKPRLRHYWHYANDLAIAPAFVAMIDPKPYMAINLAPATGGTLVYERPFSERISGEPSPYSAIQSMFPDPATMRCDAVLYRLGTDEGTVERMFKKAPSDVDTKMAADKIYDALFLIRIKFMIRIATAIDTKVTRMQVATALRRLMRNGKEYSKQFAVEIDPVMPKPGRAHDKPQLRRIFVGFAPEFNLASDFTGKHPPQAVPGGHHIFVDIVQARTTPHPLLSATPPLELPLLVTEIDESILRYALGIPTFAEDATTHAKTLKTTVAAADVQFIATLLHGTLKDDATPPRKVNEP